MHSGAGQRRLQHALQRAPNRRALAVAVCAHVIQVDETGVSALGERVLTTAYRTFATGAAPA
jgi:hypothetical protein